MSCKHRYITLALSLLLLLCLATSAHAAGVYSSGSCGEAVEWVLYNDGTLVISGSGDMDDYPSQSSMPWYNALSLIKQVEIGDGVSSVGSRAFEYARQLTNVILPSSVRVIAQEAFYGCERLNYVEQLYGGIELIGDGAFTDCPRLSAFSFPVTLRSIGVSAFCGCSSLGDTVYIPATVSYIGTGAFECCTALRMIDVSPNNLYYADISGVLYDKALTALLECPAGYAGELVLPKSLVMIADWAFVNNTGITAVDIPGKYTLLGEGAFSNCSALERLSIACPLSENCFNGCTALSELYLAEGIREIPTAAFRHCVSLTEVVFPSTVTKIGPMAFYDAGLFDVSIGGNIKTVDYLAFAECKNLQTVRFLGEAPAMSGGTGKGSFAFDSAEAVCPCFWDEADRKGYGGSLNWTTEHSLITGTIRQSEDDPCKGVFVGLCACGEQSCEETLSGRGKAIGEFVVRLYRVIFDRVPDKGGYEYYANTLYGGSMTGAQAAADFVFADEFTVRNYCDAHYVTALYLAFMGREPSEFEIESWVWRLQQGSSRESVFNSFANSTEFNSICKAAGIIPGISAVSGDTRQGGYCTVPGCTAHESIAAFAKRLYTVCLDRDPGADETDSWHYFLVHGDYTGSGAARFFLRSEEFVSHGYDDAEYVLHLYAALMGRECGEDELAYWVYVLGGGTDRDEVLEQFIQSAEFKLICQSFNVRH